MNNTSAKKSIFTKEGPFIGEIKLKMVYKTVDCKIEKTKDSLSVFLTPICNASRLRVTPEYLYAKIDMNNKLIVWTPFGDDYMHHQVKWSDVTVLWTRQIIND